jgi:hypothetical protein
MGLLIGHEQTPSAGEPDATQLNFHSDEEKGIEHQRSLKTQVRDPDIYQWS